MIITQAVSLVCFTRLYSVEEVAEIKKITFKDIIKSVTNITSAAIQDNLFFWRDGVY